MPANTAAMLRACGRCRLRLPHLQQRLASGARRRPLSSGTTALPVVPAACVVEAENELGESPVWCTQTQTLFWVDCLGGGTPKFWALTPGAEGGGLAVSEADPQLCGAIGSIGLVEGGGGLILASDCGVQLLHNPVAPPSAPTPSWGPIERLAHPLAMEGLVDFAESSNTMLRLNDGRVDRQGRFVVGAYHPDHGSFVLEDGRYSAHRSGPG